MFFSVIIPTYQRCDLVVACVSQFRHQRGDIQFEVIVVVDGSTDNTVHALQQLEVSFPLLVLNQSNKGRASALNYGVCKASGSHLMFLDDDMHADPDLLVEHASSQLHSGDLVLGHLPVHADHLNTLLGRAVENWAQDRLLRLSKAPEAITTHDLITGQASVSRSLFNMLGGFDEAFNQDGSFGNEDLDFCIRLQRAGYKVVFNPRAVSWQKYSVSPRHHLRQWLQAGSADVRLAAKHRHLRELLRTSHRKPLHVERIWAPLMRTLVLWLVDRGHAGKLVSRLFFYCRNLEYAQGVRIAGGMPQTFPVRVLAYHAIADLQDCPVVNEYAIPPALFEKQIDTLLRAGYRFITPDEFLLFLQNQIDLEKPSLLLTFDDCYSDLLTSALPILEKRNLGAVAFAVSGRLGQCNDWDAHIGATQLALLDVDGLEQLAAGGVETGAHSRSHVFLSKVTDSKMLLDETLGSVDQIAASGLVRPRFFAYPHGDFDRITQLSLQVAGMEAGFTVQQGCVRSSSSRFELPRIEVFRSDGIHKLRWKVLSAGFSLRSLPWIKCVSHQDTSVSIVVPAYNAAQTLDSTLASLHMQTHTLWQAMVVDDGSTDQTLEIANRWAQRDSRISVVSQSNEGESGARNTGIRASRSEWLMFLDSDDWITPDCLSVLLNAVSRDAALAGVVCGCVRVTPDGAIGRPDIYTPRALDDLFLQFARDCPFAVHNCLIRRSVAIQAGPFDTTLQNCADWDFWQRAARTGARFTTVPDVLAAYRMRPGSASTHADQVQRDGFTVIARGHSADSRVPDAHPSYRSGASPAGLREARYRHSVWPASLLIGQRRDARVLLDAFHDEPFPDLSPVTVANTLYECIPLAVADTPLVWQSVWGELLQLITDYLDALEHVSQSVGLSMLALRHLEFRILDDRQPEAPMRLNGSYWYRVNVDEPFSEPNCPLPVQQLVFGVCSEGMLIGSIAMAGTEIPVSANRIESAVADQLLNGIVAHRLRLNLQGEDKLNAHLHAARQADHPVWLFTCLLKSVPSVLSWQIRRGKLHRPRQLRFLLRIVARLKPLRLLRSLIQAAPGSHWQLMRSTLDEAMKSAVRGSLFQANSDAVVRTDGNMP